MTVTITIQNTNWDKLWSFIAEDYKSISQMAEKNNIDIPVACGQGSCYVCACKIKSGNKYTQIDKITPPLVTPQRDNEGNFTEIMTCVGGIKSEYIKDQENHEVILEKLV